MSTRANEAIWALTEKEKQTLRLIVRGHDAKSTARSLGLSVHTINERLRDARRKMAVSSSREAARLLLAAEGEGLPTPQLLGDMEMGADANGLRIDQEAAPIGGARRTFRPSWIFIGVLLMTLALGLLALAFLPQAVSTPTATPVAARATSNPEAIDSARQFLALLDKGDWNASYRATAPSFRELNTVKVWADVSEKARAPLGAMISRELVGQEYVPAPPYGYEVVKFRTRFVNKAEVLETVTLDRHDGSWRIAGITID